MPPVFSLADICAKQNMSSAVARVSLARWSSCGMVCAAGSKTGVYFNLAVCPDAPSSHLGSAVALVHPNAVVLGPSVLHDAGWTTQIPHGLMVGVLEARSYPAMNDVHLHKRPQAWFDRLPKSGGELGIGRHGLPVMSPEWALADMLVHADARHALKPDDVEIPDDADIGQLRAALDCFFVPDDVAEPYLRASGLSLRSL